jgi:hypothetical protein
VKPKAKFIYSSFHPSFPSIFFFSFLPAFLSSDMTLKYTQAAHIHACCRNKRRRKQWVSNTHICVCVCVCVVFFLLPITKIRTCYQWLKACHTLYNFTVHCLNHSAINEADTQGTLNPTEFHSHDPCGSPTHCCDSSTSVTTRSSVSVFNALLLRVLGETHIQHRI